MLRLILLSLLAAVLAYLWVQVSSSTQFPVAAGRTFDFIVVGGKPEDFRGVR